MGKSTVRSRRFSEHEESKDGRLEPRLTSDEWQLVRGLVAVENGEEEEGFTAGDEGLL
jgi:hypothetical protein